MKRIIFLMHGYDICGNSTSVQIPARIYMGEIKAQFFTSQLSISFHATALVIQSKNLCMVLKSKILKYKVHSYSRKAGNL